METETVTTWLSQFPPEAQPLITAWFAYAVSQRPQSPEAVLVVVARLCAHKMDWSTTPPSREACHLTLLALCHQRAGALAYAASLLAQKEGL